MKLRLFLEDNKGQSSLIGSTDFIDSVDIKDEFIQKTLSLFLTQTLEYPISILKENNGVWPEECFDGPKKRTKVAIELDYNEEKNEIETGVEDKGTDEIPPSNKYFFKED